MTTNLFDKPPSGYIRAKKGWLIPAPSPQRKTVEKLKAENADLKSRMDELENMVLELTNKKSKKSS